MSNEDVKKEETIYSAALKISSLEERTTYLKKACGEDKELLERVQALLRAHEQAGDFLEVPPFIAKEVTLDEVPIREGPGTVIEPYKLLEKIGEGGMAMVYMAEQEHPIRRKVALKIIKLGMDTKQVIARFEAERQALAMMDHLNIAKVLDAGATETGRPYFVMELVKGVSITEYCDKNESDTKERLDLFISVCNAVQHAHQKGIIHRDIKPSNVMVTLQDGKPLVKVIDFGIAKATTQRLTEKTLFTRYAQMIGTPAYMSPEQAEMSALDIDTRTDIYSLGVLLYELLTGVTPFDAEKLREAGYGEIQRVIREQEPPKPSTRLSTLGERLTVVAKHRHCSPDMLRKLVHGDLDWIVMKSIEKDRTRRYDTASEMARDIEHHLNHEPVKAAAPSLIYKLHKFILRHQAAVGALVTIVLILVVGIIISTIGFLQAKRQRELAVENFDKARNAVDEMIQIGRSGFPGASTPELARIQLTILTKAQAFYKEFLENNPGSQQMLENYAQLFKYLGQNYMLLEEFQKAESAYQKAIEIFESLSKEYPSQSETYEREVACGWSGTSFALSGQGKDQQAKEARQICIQNWKPMLVEYHFGTLSNPGRPFNTEGLDGTPSQRADGLEMFFGSNRSGGRGDVWYCWRQSVNDSWSEPTNNNLVIRINTANYEGKPHVSSDGLELYFMAERKEGYGSCDIWMSKRNSVHDSWAEPKNLGRLINSSAWEGTPCLALDGLALYFESNRVGSLGSEDIWITKRTSRQSPWGEPVNVGLPVNSLYGDTTPYLTRDGLVLIFSSSRPVSFGLGDLWLSKRDSKGGAWSEPVNLGPDINSLFIEGHPSISFDNSTLFMAKKDFPGGLGGHDMWTIPILASENETTAIEQDQENK